MTDDKSKAPRSQVSHLLASGLLGLAANGPAAHAQSVENSATESQAPGHQALRVEQAMQALAGMGGIYRVDEHGDTYLYPLIKLKQDLHGMHGIYRIGPQGIILQPTGMESADLGIDALGGISGSFRVTPEGDAYFQPKAHAPIGMSGETGREQHRGSRAP